MKWQGFTNLIVAFVLLFSTFACKVKVSSVQVTHAVVQSERTVSDSTLTHFLSPYKGKIDSLMDVELVYNPQILLKEIPESNLGNMMADIIFDIAQKNGLQPDFAVTNIGGIRVPMLDSGMLTTRDAFQLMPFDNTIVVQEISGATANKLFQHLAQWGGWPISHAKAKISSAKEILVPIYIGGEILDTTKTYRLATTDYLALGGDKCFFLQDYSIEKTNILLRDGIISHWKTVAAKGDSLYIQKEGRIVYE